MTDEKEIRDRLRESLPELPPSAQPPDLYAMLAGRDPVLDAALAAARAPRPR